MHQSVDRRRGFDPNEPRDEGGRWTDGGGDGGGSGGSDKPKPAEAAPDPAVANVGGDTWNKETAQRLESEYAKERSDLEAIVSNAPGRSIMSSDTSGPAGDDEDEPVYTPQEWNDLDSSTQSDIEENYVKQNQKSFYDSEVQSWYDGGAAKEDAQSVIVEEFNSGDDQEWAEEAINGYREERQGEGKADIPFTNEQLINAINLKYPGYGDLQISFDDSQLQEPKGHDPSQMTLPGVEIDKPEDKLTDDMRADIEAALNKAFENAADDKVSNMDPPDYLMESAQESAANWFGEMADDEKFAWAKDNTDIIEDGATDKDGNPVASGEAVRVGKLPDKYDPLNTTSGEDYKRTQALAHYLSLVRTADVMAERGVGPDIAGVKKGSDEWKNDIKDRMVGVDKTLWSAWKESSTSRNGKLLQVATADELGGRLNTDVPGQINRDEVIKDADQRYAKIGGYDGVKAAVRAKWETTQYLLDKAGIKNLDLYRGITVKPDVFQKLIANLALRHYAAHQQISGHQYMPTIQVVRNGAASTTTDPGVANDWGGGSNRVVLRAAIPRTAAISIPAYGQNIHSEREVVVAGTAWHGWDAWAGRAPTFDHVPLRQAA